MNKCCYHQIICWIKAKIYSFLVDGNSKHQKAKSVNKNVVATLSYCE